MKLRPVAKNEFVDLYQFSASQMHWSVRNAIAAQEEENLGASRSAQALNALLPQVAVHITRLNNQLFAQTLPASPALQTADRKLDGTYSRFVSRVGDMPILYGEGSERGKAALKLLKGPLSLPISAVTNIERQEQETLLKDILDRIRANHLPDISTLEVEAHFQLLEQEYTEFVRQMSVDARMRTAPSRSELEEERKHLQSLMVGCILRILGDYPDPTNEDLAMRTKLLGPFAYQKDLMAQYYRRRRSGAALAPPEVDSDTGEPLEPAASNDVLQPAVPAEA